MVGVLRSKACLACRVRRKRCDEIRPSCALCIKRGIECAYRNELNIVFVNPGANTTSRTSSPLIKWGSDKSSSNSSEPSPNNLPVSCLATSYRNQVHGHFLTSYIPRQSGRWSRLDTDLSPSACTAWMETADQFAGFDVLLNDSLTALSLAYIERQQGQNDTLPRSRLMYGRAMRTLSLKLGSQNSASDSSLAASMALAAYEVQAATKHGAIGWLSHVKGTSQIVQVRGKQNLATEFGQKLYVGSRLNDLINAIGRRKALSNSSPSFVEEFPSQFQSFVRLFDILNNICSIQELGDAINALPQDVLEADLASKVSMMSYLCQEFELQLESWYRKLESEFASCEPLFREEPSNLYNKLPLDSPSRVFPAFLCYLNLDIAQQIVLHWTCLLIANFFLYDIEASNLRQRSYPNITLFPTDTARMVAAEKLHSMATNILKSLEYFVHPDLGLTATDFLGLPLNLAYGYFRRRGSQELLWFEVIFNRLREMNTGFGDFMEAMAQQGGGGQAFKMLVFQSQPQPPIGAV